MYGEKRCAEFVLIKKVKMDLAEKKDVYVKIADAIVQV